MYVLKSICCSRVFTGILIPEIHKYCLILFKTMLNCGFSDTCQFQCPQPAYIPVFDVAKSTGVVYYERQKLIFPEDKADNKYRYYSFGQSRRLLEIRRLRNMGFSVQEISRLIDISEQDEIRTLFEEKIEQTNENLVWNTSLLNYYQTYLEQIKYLNELPVWYVTKRPLYYFLPHTVEDGFIEKKTIHERFQAWTDYMPLVQSAFVEALDTNHNDMSAIRAGCFGMAVQEEFIKRFGLSTDEPVLRIESCRCFEYRFLMPVNLPRHEYAKYTHFIFELARQQGFVPDGDLFMLFQSYIHIEGVSYQYHITYLPIKTLSPEGILA